jgi:hypothetical protein
VGNTPMTPGIGSMREIIFLSSRQLQWVLRAL